MTSARVRVWMCALSAVVASGLLVLGIIRYTQPDPIPERDSNVDELPAPDSFELFHEQPEWNLDVPLDPVDPADSRLLFDGSPHGDFPYEGLLYDGLWPLPRARWRGEPRAIEEPWFPRESRQP